MATSASISSDIVEIEIREVFLGPTKQDDYSKTTLYRPGEPLPPNVSKQCRRHLGKTVFDWPDVVGTIRGMVAKREAAKPILDRESRECDGITSTSATPADRRKPTQVFQVSCHGHWRCEVSITYRR